RVASEELVSRPRRKASKTKRMNRFSRRLSTPFVQRTESMRLSRSIFLILALAFFFAQPANATRLPADLEKVISWQFPGARVRIDGAIETQKKDLYLPLIPEHQATSRKG